MIKKFCKIGVMLRGMHATFCLNLVVIYLTLGTIMHVET